MRTARRCVSNIRSELLARQRQAARAIVEDQVEPNQPMTDHSTDGAERDHGHDQQRLQEGIERVREQRIDHGQQDDQAECETREGFTLFPCLTLEAISGAGVALRFGTEIGLADLAHDLAAGQAERMARGGRFNRDRLFTARQAVDDIEPAGVSGQTAFQRSGRIIAEREFEASPDRVARLPLLREAAALLFDFVAREIGL